ncbi:MAG: hypothetical protein LUQ54_06165 [Methanoregula sp.]|nr:hypothetical protein [Methanoregula sp.]
MKKLALVLILAIALLVSSVSAGNGIDLKGQHFTLNLIGSKDKTSMPDNLGGHTIFVTLDRSGEKATTTILLKEGDFAVLDKNGADGQASFQLPYPFTAIDEDGILDGNEVACYEIYARALSPKGYANMYTCTEDVDADYGFGTYCDTGNTVVLKRPDGNGVGKFQRVTSQLTTLENVPGVGDIPIFADTEDTYWWTYDNYGLKHAQLRFYPTATCASH